MRYEVLLADADGTLFDFHAGERLALQAVFREARLPADDSAIALYSGINERHWKRLERGETTPARLRTERFADYLAALGRDGDPEALCAAYVDALGQQRLLISGAEAFCREISARMPIYLVTNGLSRVQRSRFAGCALAPYLAGFVISEECGHPKPEPHMLREAMRLAGVRDSSRAVMLGDSVTADMGAARNAGVDGVLFTNGGDAPPGHGAAFAAGTLAEAGAWILGR